MKAEILPPLSASVHVKPAGWRFGLRLWLPLFLLVAAAFAAADPGAAAAVRRVPDLPRQIVALAARREWCAGRAARGAQVDVDSRDTKVSIKVH